MKFLADANISIEMVAMLRELGHDCSDPAAIPPRMQDVDVLRGAADNDRIVITSDKDFGELVFVHAIRCPGVVIVAWIESQHAATGAYPADLSGYSFRFSPSPRRFQLGRYHATPSGYSVAWYVVTPSTSHWYASDTGWGYYPD